MKANNYLNRLFITLISFTLLASVFNLIVDPYGVFRLASINNFNKNKVVENPPLRLQRAYEAYHENADAVILGTSRVGVGLDEQHSDWAPNVTNPKNFSLSGSNMYELKSYLKHLHHVSPLKQVVIGLDFFSFNDYMHPATDFDLLRLAKYNGHLPLQGFIKDIGPLLFSIDATRQSFITVFKQNKSLNSNDNIKSQRQNFELLEQSYLTNTWFPCPEKKFSLNSIEKQDSNFKSFLEVLQFTRSNNIDLRLFISPVHARLLIALDQAGLWKKFEDWKRLLVETVNKEAQLSGNKNAYKIWDFSFFNEFTTEKVPQANDYTSQMQWFEDSAHFSKVYGRIILNQILSDKNQHGKTTGKLIDSANIDNWLTSIKHSKKIYENNYPNDVSSIKNKARKIARWNQRKNVCIN